MGAQPGSNQEDQRRSAAESKYGVEIPLNNSAEIAQWYLERGADLGDEVGLLREVGRFLLFGMMILLFPITVAVLGILLIGDWLWRRFRYDPGGEAAEARRQRRQERAKLGANEMRRIGFAMNEAAGRPEVERIKGYRGTRFMSGWKGERYGEVPPVPPVEPVFLIRTFGA